MNTPKKCHSKPEIVLQLDSISAVAAPDEYKIRKVREKSEKEIIIDELGKRINNMNISGELKKYIIKTAKNESDISVVDDPDYINVVLSRAIGVDDNGYDILIEIARDVGDWKNACNEFFKDIPK